MAKQQKKGKGGNRKIGRNESKCKRYAAMHKREMHKVKNVLRSNGVDAAVAYARTHNVEGYLHKLMGSPA